MSHMYHMIYVFSLLFWICSSVCILSWRVWRQYRSKQIPLHEINVIVISFCNFCSFTSCFICVCGAALIFWVQWLNLLISLYHTGEVSQGKNIFHLSVDYYKFVCIIVVNEYIWYMKNGKMYLCVSFWSFQDSSIYIVCGTHRGIENNEIYKRDRSDLYYIIREMEVACMDWAKN